MSNIAIEAKFDEFHHHLKSIERAEKAQDFYASVNALLVVSRSLLYVSQHQHGWRERPKGIEFTPSEKQVRQRFDVWYEASASVQTLLAHPLTADRHDVVHRSGQAGFVHIPLPDGYGLAVSHGTPFKQALWRTRRGLGGLPFRDKNDFFYLDSTGQKTKALPYLAEYATLVNTVVREIQSEPWA